MASDQVRLFYKVDASNPSPVCAGLFKLKLVAVVIKADPSIIIRFGVIEMTTGSLNPNVLLDNNEPLTRFFTGLVSFISNDKCIKLKLASDEISLNVA